MFSDLECDYINPIDLCNKLNQVHFLFCISNPSFSCLRPLTRFSCLQFVLPENIAHAFLTVLFLLSGQWIAFLLNAPLLIFNANKYVARQPHNVIAITRVFVDRSLQRLLA